MSADQEQKKQEINEALDVVAKPVIEAAIGAWEKHADKYGTVKIGSGFENANFPAANVLSMGMNFLCLSGQYIPMMLALAGVTYCLLPRSFGKATVSVGKDTRTTHFFRPAEDEEGSDDDRLADENGMPLRSDYMTFSRDAAREIADVEPGVMMGIMLGGYMTDHGKTVPGFVKDHPVEGHREKLADVFSRAVERRVNALPGPKGILQNLGEDVTKGGVFVGFAAIASGILMGNSVLVASGIMIAWFAAYPKSNPLRSKPVEIPEMSDPDMSACRTPEGGVMFGVSPQGARRIAAAEPAAMDFIITQTQRFMTPQKKHETPAPAPK